VTRNRYKPIKSQPLNHLSEEELAKRLFRSILAIVAILIVSLGSLLFFAPKIGGIFAFISVNYNNEDRPVEVAPTAPFFKYMPESTKEESITITGFTEPGITVKLFVNGPEVQSTLTDSEGQFTFVSVKLIKGKNTIYSKAVDSKGTESANSSILTILYDDKAPEITIENLENGQTVKNLDKRILVKGKVDEKSIVRVNSQLAQLKPDLTFEIVIGASDGEMIIKVEATDEAGNSSTEELTIKYVKSSG
jgi:archaellum component FlaF (FlaF/FlaG flagellin family)